MIPYDRKNLDEFLMTLELEPSIHDIVVEGPNDRDVLDWYLCQECGFIGAKIFLADEINVPSEIVSIYSGNADDGSRGRVIAIAKYAQNKYKCKNNLSCIIDTDTDVLFNINNQADTIIKTDFSCMEMYYFEEKILKKFFKLFCSLKVEKKISSLLADFGTILNELFLIRAANKFLNWKMKWLDIDKFIKFKNESPAFDCVRFIKSYLNKNAKCSQINEFENCLNMLKLQIKTDKRNYINGHDFLRLLALFVKYKQNSNKLFDVIVTGRPLRTSLCTSHVNNFNLFKKLQEKSEVQYNIQIN